MERSVNTQKEPKVTPVLNGSVMKFGRENDK